MILAADDLLDRFRHEITNRLAAGNPIPDRGRGNVDFSSHYRIAFFDRGARPVERYNAHQALQLVETAPARQLPQVVFSDEKEKFRVRSLRSQLLHRVD